MDEQYYQLKRQGRVNYRRIQFETRDKNKKRRSSSEKGHRNLGNSQNKFCSYCRPSLSTRLNNRQNNINESKMY